MWKLLTARWGSGAGEIADVKIDGSTESLQTVDYSHHEIHAGSHFFGKNFVDFGVSDTEDNFYFTTPDSDVQIHAKAAFYGSAEFEIEIFEGVTIGTAGTTVAAQNNNRDLQTSHPATLIAAASGVLTGGTAIWRAKTGDGKNSTGVSPEISGEIIAKRNTTYMFKITKTATTAAYIDVNFFWYEHTPKH